MISLDIGALLQNTGGSFRRFERDLSFDMLVGFFGQADGAGSGERLYAGSYIDPVSVDVAPVDDYVTDIGANA
jgi:hypothetical protein